MKLNIDDLDLADSVELNDQSVKFKFSNFLVLFILLGLVLMVVYSTVMTQLSQKTKKVTEEPNLDRS